MNINFYDIKENDLTYGMGYVYSLQYHIVWCTKYRRKVLKDGVDSACKEFLHALAEEYRFEITAMKVIDKVLASAGPTTYQLQLIHGYNRGTSLRSMIHDWYQYEPKVKRIMPGDNPGITVLVLKELY